MKPPVALTPAKRMKTRFRFTVLHIRNNEQRFVKENLFRLCLTHVMLVATFTGVPAVPIKSFNAIPVYHACI